jgi:hypothetical protein
LTKCSLTVVFRSRDPPAMSVYPSIPNVDNGRISFHPFITSTPNMYSQLSQTVSGLGVPQASAFGLPQSGGPSQLPGAQAQPVAFSNDQPARGSPLTSMSPSDLLEACRRELQSGSQVNALILLRGLESRISPSRHQDQTSSVPDVPEEKRTHSKRKPTPFVACTLCRQCKAKCIKSDPLGPKCDRCKAAGCACVYETHKRGRKR